MPQQVRELLAHGVARVIVVDDGSGADCEPLFAAAEQAGAILLSHPQNRGKGAALKTGFWWVIEHCPDCAGVVTADADGQHATEDVVAVAQALIQNPDCLVLGVRRFEGSAPFRSRFGNALTRRVLRRIVGQDLQDTQTGLRGIPLALLPELVQMPSRGYEFELDMLIAARHHRRQIREVPIRTIYREENLSSHFNPLLDSVKISFVLLRFSLVSLATALIDNLVFVAAHTAGAPLAAAQAAGRLIAGGFQYESARRAVFLSRQAHCETLPRYIALVAASGLVSYALIQVLISRLPVGVLAAKSIVEGLLFALNFLAQRDFVFVTDRARRTDWDAYYQRPAAFSRVTRRYTQRVLLAMMRRAGLPPGATITEFGGAGSCFLAAVRATLRPARYTAVDNNHPGCELLRAAWRGDSSVEVLEADIFGPPLALADWVYSVGLIEHFDARGTSAAIRAHFAAARPGGFVILSFPTPTLLYRVASALTELAGQWRYSDERPLERAEVLAAVGAAGQLLDERVLYPIVFTQRMMLFRVTAR